MELEMVWSQPEQLPRLSFAWKCSSRPSSADPASVPCAFPFCFSYLTCRGFVVLPIV
ncbi:hypothetical protein IG631_17347 [Alternaria alternata]|nr:hypothetical protein IG631_17347 [Alternaria alternata]